MDFRQSEMKALNMTEVGYDEFLAVCTRIAAAMGNGDYSDFDVVYDIVRTEIIKANQPQVFLIGETDGQKKNTTNALV